MANKIFYTILTLLILGSIGTTFYKIVWQKDYQIVAQTSCDPTSSAETGKCYVTTCDPAEDETCPLKKEDRTTYYKMISKKAANIAACEATAEKIGCDKELTCTPNEVSCSYTYCDSNNLADGETCAE